MTVKELKDKIDRAANGKDWKLENLFEIYETMLGHHELHSLLDPLFGAGWYENGDPSFDFLREWLNWKPETEGSAA